MTEEQQQPGLLANILAVAGFIILIIIIVWGAYNLLRLTGSGLSNIFSRFGVSEITVVAPESPVQAGRAFPLSWQYAPEEEGTYALLYQCNDGFRLDVQSLAGTMFSIPCGSAYGVGSTNSLTLTPQLSGSSTIEVPLTLIFVPAATSSEERPQGSATVTVAPGSAPAVTTPSTTQTPSTTTQAPKPTGSADLSVRILSVGVIDSASGVFVERVPGQGDTAAVQFDIKNNGTAASGSYHFSVQLPTQLVYPYISAAQASLAPGAHVVSTLRFGPVAPGGGTIAVEVDSQRAVRDSNRANNTSAVWMNAANYPYYNQAPFVY